MRALARAFLFLASAVWLAAPSAAQTVTNSVNIQFNFADFQQNPANVSQVKFTPIPTNAAVNGFLLHQEFPNFTRATAPSLTNGTLTISNVLKGVVYETTFTARGREQTYYINADTNAADGATIGAWTNVVAPTNLFGLFLSYLPNVPGAQVGYVPIATDTLGHYAWGPQTGGGGGGGNVTGPGSSIAHHVAAYANTSGQLLEDAGYLNTAVLPWANWTTNAFGASAFKPTSFFDLAGAGTTAATAATNGYPWGTLYDSAGRATAATNGYPWSSLYDAAGTATAATNGYPWGVLYDALNSALNATNGMGITSGLSAFVNTNRFASSNVATAAKAGIVKVDNSSITVAADGTISATTGGGGSVTSVNVAQQGFSSSGAVTTSGTITLTQNADVNHLGFGETNISKLASTNTAIVGGPFIDPTNVFQVDTLAGAKAFQVGTNGAIYGSGANFTALNASQVTGGTLPVTVLPSSVVTNNGPNTFTGDQTVIGTVTGTAVKVTGATASTVAVYDAGKNLVSIANPATGNGTFAFTSDNSGTKGWTSILDGSALKASQYVATGSTTNLVSTQDGGSWTNLTGTNIVLDTSTLAATSNGTNYTAVLRSGLPGVQTIITDHTNVNLSLVGTNLADVGRTVFINNFTNLANCNVTFTFTACTNFNFSTVISNGWGAVLNFWNADTSGTNVLVSDAGRYHH